jgi:hypothetical protein
MSVLLWKESLYPDEENPGKLKPEWTLEGQLGDETAARERAKLLAQHAPEGHTTGRYAIAEVPDPPGEILKASVPDSPTVSLRKVK